MFSHRKYQRLSHVLRVGWGIRRRNILRAEGPDPETPTLTRMSPSKFLALRPLVSSVEQTSECTVLTLF